MKVVIGAFALACAGSALAAQDWRTLESSRQRTGDDPVAIRVEYAAGRIDLRPTADRVLYRMHLRYDADHVGPVATYDAATRTVTMGVRSTRSASWNSHGDESGTMTAELPRGVPLRLALELGATEGRILLGGLRLADLSLKTGAAEIRIDVPEPNAESLGTASLDVGAAKVVIARAGNLRPGRVHLNVGVGSLDYDLSGDWTGEVALDVSLALGGVTLRAPDDVGVRVDASTFLVDLGKSGLVRRGSVWETPNYDAAHRHATVHLNAALGSFEIVRAER